MGGSELNKSFFYARDTRHGWGNMSYFTFFSEFNRSWEGAAYIEATVTAVLFLLTVVGNILLLISIGRNKAARTVTNYLVVNLAVADLFFLTSSPFVASVRLTDSWRLGKVMCHMLSYSMFVSGFVMIWTMTFISIHRYIGINPNISTARRFTYRHVIMISIVIWCLGFLLFSTVAVFFILKNINLANQTITICTMSWPSVSEVRFSILFTALVSIFGYAIPIIIITCNYSRIFWTVRKTSEAVTGSIHGIGSIKRRKSQSLRIVKTLVLLVVMFILMWTPTFILFGLIQYDVRHEFNELPSSALLWAVNLAYLNAGLNPFLYGFLNRKLRNIFCSCCCLFRREETTMQPNPSARSQQTVITEQELPLPPLVRIQQDSNS